MALLILVCTAASMATIYLIGSFICTLHFHSKFNYYLNRSLATNDPRWLECMELAHRDTKATVVLGGFWPSTLKRWNIDYMAEISEGRR